MSHGIFTYHSLNLLKQTSVQNVSVTFIPNKICLVKPLVPCMQRFGGIIYRTNAKVKTATNNLLTFIEWVM